MHYHIKASPTSKNFLDLIFTINHIHQDILHLQLPAWRPGRYELQNFAKNIRNVEMKNESGENVAFHKITKDKWEVDTTNVNTLIVSYEYFANQLDAGGSFIGSDFIYINPVNCCMYVDGRIDEPYEVTLTTPENYQIATQMPIESNLLKAPNFDYLADSPIIAGASIEHHSFKINNNTNNIHFWIQGKHPFDIECLKVDTQKYAEAQTRLFGDMPSKEYHFLYLILEHPFRHGVEHLDSTVIAMGQTADNTDEEFYNDLLAISCHELFHLWNIKRIRPAEMLPYDFTAENYSQLGYVYEGVTTYYGDLILLRSGVWDFDQYATSLCSDFKRHFDNPGRFNYSVAESSWDTWLDGYVPGVPGRKVSIYMEGLIAAFIADVVILKNTNGKKRLDDILNVLYQHDAKRNLGYSAKRYQSLLEEISGISFNKYFDEVINGKGLMQNWLLTILDAMGIELLITTVNEETQVKLKMHPKPDDSQTELFNMWVKSL